MVNAKLKCNGVEYNSFEKKNTFFEFQVFFSVGIERICFGTWSRGPPCRSTGLESMAFNDDSGQSLGRLLRLGCEEDTSHGDFEAIVLREGMFGEEAVKEDHGARDGEAGQFEDSAGFFDEAARFGAFQFFIGGGDAVFVGGQVGG